MKKITLFFLSILFVSVVHAQDIMPMKDVGYVAFTLDKVPILITESINRFKTVADKEMYYAKLKFGKRRFELEVYEIATGQMVWATYATLKTGESYFRKDVSKSDQYKEVYTLTQDDGVRRTKYEVAINKLSSGVSLFYSESVDKKVVRAVTALGPLPRG